MHNIIRDYERRFAMLQVERNEIRTELAHCPRAAHRQGVAVDEARGRTITASIPMSLRPARSATLACLA